VRERHVLADPGQRELVQLGEGRLQAGQGSMVKFSVSVV
jgi:hypothetical protein